MKKKMISLLLVFAITLSLCPITAYALDSGTLYYGFTEITSSSSFAVGTTYLFTSTHYTSADAVSAIIGNTAQLKMVSDSNASSGYMSANISQTPSNYVEVIKAGSDFDGCQYGGIIYTTISQKFSGQAGSAGTGWFYWCFGSGCRGAGPYYAYTYSTKTFTADDVKVTINYDNLDATDTVTKDDLTVTVDDYTVSDYLVTDGAITPSDRNFTLNVGGVSVTETAGSVITFTTDPNSTGTTTTSVKTPDIATIAVPSSDGTYAGHTFMGWSVTQGSSVVSYAPGDSYILDASATFYAVWVADTYAVTYDANGGSGAPSDQTKTYNVSLALSLTKPVWDGHVFTGWNTSSGGGSTSYASGATYAGNAALKLYAQWSSDTYTVGYNANGGTGEPSDQTKAYGAVLTLTSAQPSRDGFTFVGWAADASAESADYASGGSYSLDDSVTLYAVWQSATDTVSYNANGGSGAPSQQSKTYGVDLTLSSSVPERDGYTFLGWSTSSNGDALYDAGGTYTEEASVVLYAVWEAETYDVFYDDNVSGESITVPDAQEKSFGETMILSSYVPQREGYTFVTWCTEPDADEEGAVLYAPGAIYAANDGATLFAIWEASKYYTSTGLAASPSTGVYAGDEVCLTATVWNAADDSVHPSGGTVTFYAGDTVLGTCLVGAGGAATYYTDAVIGQTTYSAVFNGSDEAYLSTNVDNTVTLTVKGVTIELADEELEVMLDGEETHDALTVGETYVLIAPTVYAPDDETETALTAGTQYTVQWYWYNGSSWCEVNSDNGKPDQLTVTPSAEGQKWYAKIYPAGKYTRPSSGLSTEQVTCGVLIGTATTLTASPTAAYENASDAVTLTASVKDSANSPVTDGWVMFMDENDTQVGYAKLDNQGRAAVTVTLPSYSGEDDTAYYYAAYEGTAAYTSSDNADDMTAVTVKSTTFAVPTITVTSGVDTVGTTTTSQSVTGLIAGETYTLTANTDSLKGVDGYAVTSGDYTLYWQKVSGGNTVTVATGSTYTFTAVKGEAYRLFADARNNMKVGAVSCVASVDVLAAPSVSLDTAYTFLGSSDASTGEVASNRIDGSHVGDEIVLTATVAGTSTVPTGTVDFYYISGGSPVKLARVPLTEWDTNVSQAVYTVSGSRLSAGVYTFYAVYNGSSTYSTTAYNSQYDDNGTPGDPTDDTSDPSARAYRVWSVTIASSALITASPAVADNLLTAGTEYTFTMGGIDTTDGQHLTLGTDYIISWYVSTSGSSTGYGSAAYISTGAADNTWTQTPASSSYLYKAVVTPITGSENAKYPLLGVTSNTLSTSTAVTASSVSADAEAVYEGNSIKLTAVVSPTGSSVPDGTVEFYYYTSDPDSKTLIGSAAVQTRTTSTGTVYYAQLTTSVLPDNNGYAQDVCVYALYTGNAACASSSATTSAILVKSSEIDSATPLIITANGSFADDDNGIPFSSGILPADGSDSTLKLGTVTTKDGASEPLDEDDFVITWEMSTNYSGSASAATWTTIKTGEYLAQVAPTTYATAYRVKITPKFEEKTVMSASAYYSNIIAAGTASSVTQMSFVSSDTPATAGSDLTVNVKVFGGGEAPTGTVTLYRNGSPVATNDLVNGITAFSVSDLAPGKYTFLAAYASTNGYSAGGEEEVFYVRYSPAIALESQTYTYDAMARYYDTDGVTVTGLGDGLSGAAAATVSCRYQDAAGNAVTPVDAGTYTVYAYLPETQEYAAAEATGTLVIEPRTLTVTDFIVQAKTYDATTAVSIMTVDTDVIHGDSVLMGGSAVLDSANAGSRTVTYTPAITGGDDAANYRLAAGYTVTDTTVVSRNQLAGAITADGVIALYKADGSAMAKGTGAGQYSVAYYYHSGSGVKSVASLTSDGKYTVVVRPNDTADFKGGISTTMTVTSGVKSYSPVTCSIPVSFAISNTMQIWDGTAKTVTVTPSISGFTGYSVTYNAAAGTDTSKVGVYGIDIKVTASGYTGSASGRMQVILGKETNKASISVDDKVYDGSAAQPVVTGTPDGNYYIAYTGGNIQGVSYVAPKDAGTYTATLFAESTDTVTVYTASDTFTISKKAINLTADDKTRQQYATDPVWTYTADGLVSADSSTDFITQPAITVVSKGSNDNFDQVGTYTLAIAGAYAANYSFTYATGTLSVNSVDPNVPMTIIGLPNGAVRYGESFRLFTYGTRGVMVSDDETVGYSDSSVISYSVVSGYAEISGDILTITGTGPIVLKVTRGEGQDAVYSTISFDASARAVQIAPTFGTNTYDGTTEYNATGAVITGTVESGETLDFSGIRLDTTGKVDAGSYVMVVSVADGNGYYAGSGAGLMTISPASALVTADDEINTYGTAPAVDTIITGSLPAAPVGYSAATASSDVGTYENFAAGVSYSKNYIVGFQTGIQTIEKLPLTITAGSLDGTESGVSTTAAVAAASFEQSGERIYGAGNQIMDYTVATLISGDSLADLTVGSDGVIVSYDKDKTSDANRTYPDHSAAVEDLEDPYAIELGSLDAVNYDITGSEGALNIYQRNVTVTAADGAVVTKAYDGTAATVVPATKYVINNIVNNDVIGLVYTAAFSSPTLFVQADDAVTMTILSLSGEKKANYYLVNGSLTLEGRILLVGTSAPTAVGTNTFTMNAVLYDGSEATQVGFYVGKSAWTADQMIKVPMDGVTGTFGKTIDAFFTSLVPAANTEYKYYAYVVYGGTEYAGEAVTFRTAAGTGGVTVTVTTSSTSAKEVTVSIAEGSNILASAVTSAASGSNGSAVFAGLKSGVFNVIISSGSWSDTQSVTVAAGVSTPVTFDVPVVTVSGYTSTSVTIEDGALSVAVDGLSDQFDDDSVVYTDEDKEAVAGGGSVRLDLNVGVSSDTTLGSDDASKFEISLTKTTTTSDGQITQVPVTELGSIIELAVPLTAKQIAEKTKIVIYREHDGATPVAMTKLTARQTSPYTTEGYYVDYSLGYVFIYSKEFSSFYIVEPSTSSSGSTGGGGGSVSTYEITATAGEGGTITPATATVSDGASKTFTITADDGYTISDVLVDGVSVGAVSQYTFEDVSADHTIKAVFSNAWVNPFIDVDEDDWFYEAVEYTASRGLMVGTSANTFEPYTSTTRAMVVTILYRLEGEPAVSSASGFQDVAAGQWYTDAVAWGAANGIVKGYDADTFGPTDIITREQLATIFCRYASYKGYDVTGAAQLGAFADASGVSDWALSGVQWAVDEGLIIGTDKGTLEPTGNVTRAQLATVLMRFVKNLEDE